MPDDACAYENVEKNNNTEIRGKRCVKPLIYLWSPLSIFCVLRRV